MKILAIDSNFLCNQARYAYKAIALRGGKNGVIFGFLRKLIAIADAVRPTVTVFVWDGGSYKRKEEYKGY